MPELAVSGHPSGPAVPALIAGAGDRAAWRFIEFFTVNIRNGNTRAAYGRAAAAFLCWCEARGIRPLQDVQPVPHRTHCGTVGRVSRLPSCLPEHRLRRRSWASLRPSCSAWRSRSAYLWLARIIARVRRQTRPDSRADSTQIRRRFIRLFHNPLRRF